MSCVEESLLTLAVVSAAAALTDGPDNHMSRTFISLMKLQTTERGGGRGAGGVLRPFGKNG